MTIKKTKLPENPAKAMNMQEVISKFSQMDEETVEKILVQLLDEKNLEMKTDIPVPLALTRLEVLGDYVDSEFKRVGLENSVTAKLITTFARKFRVNRVSYDRKSREEIIRALSERFGKDYEEYCRKVPSRFLPLHRPR